jgi:hypothetical protein
MLALLEASYAAQRPVVPDVLATGNEVLTARLVSDADASRPVVDVTLPDGRTLRARCQENAEIWLPSLPNAELSVRLAP